MKKLYQHVNKINFMMLNQIYVNIVNKVKSIIKKKNNANILLQLVIQECTLISLLENVQRV